MDNSPAPALNAPQIIVNLSYRAIMPQDGLWGNNAITRINLGSRRTDGAN